MRYFNKSFTLIEALIVIVILTVSVFSLWQVFIASLNLTIKAKEITEAADDLKNVFEKIRCVNFPDITSVFPDNGSVSGDIAGGFSLKDESITVSYPGGEEADPLVIKAVVSWLGKDGKSYSREFFTMRTSY